MRGGGGVPSLGEGGRAGSAPGGALFALRRAHPFAFGEAVGDGFRSVFEFPSSNSFLLLSLRGRSGGKFQRFPSAPYRSLPRSHIIAASCGRGHVCLSSQRSAAVPFIGGYHAAGAARVGVR